MNEQVLPLERVRLHLRITDTLEDAVLTLYRDGAIAHASAFLGGELITPEALIEGGGGIVVNGAIVSALLLLVGFLYENRTGGELMTRTDELPAVVRALLNPYRISLGV